MRKLITSSITLFIVATTLLVSCKDSTREQAKKSAGSAEKTEEPVASDDPLKEEAENAAKQESGYLIENKILHAFSDPSEKDEFRIVITGKSITKGKVLFTITNSEGKQILKEAFDADYFLGYDFEGNIHSAKETDAHITKRIQTFFTKDHFSVPAIAPNIVFKEEDQGYYIDKETWQEIKSNKQAVGFYYLLGKEDGRHIAYSKKKGKVVMYYNCC